MTAGALLYDVFNGWVCCSRVWRLLTSETVYWTEARMREEVTEEENIKHGKVFKVTNTQTQRTKEEESGRDK